MSGTERMSAAEYLALMKTKPAAGAGKKSGGRMLRLPADFVQAREQPAKPAEVPVARPARESSAAKARDRVGSVVEALEAARTDVQYEVLESGQERVTIRVEGGETLPPNRAANIGREQSRLSQRAFSRYKHACADRMADAAMLLQTAVRKAGRNRFNQTFGVTHISYLRQVSRVNKQIDEDAVAYSFKYVLDGLVRAGVLVDDSRRYIRIVAADQAVAKDCILVIELETQGS